MKKTFDKFEPKMYLNNILETNQDISEEPKTCIINCWRNGTKKTNFPEFNPSKKVLQKLKQILTAFWKMKLFFRKFEPKWIENCVRNKLECQVRSFMERVI